MPDRSDHILKMVPEGGILFFATFARVEFTLKYCGYLRDTNGAQADWHKLDDRLGDGFFEQICTSDQANTLISSPPKMQICSNGSLEWRQMPPVNNTRALFDAVRRVRNNLFHGGKSGHPDDDSVNQKRNKKLIAEAQWVLEQAMKQSDEMIHIFNGRF